MKIKTHSALLVLALPAAVFATEYQTVERPRQECGNAQIQEQKRDYGVDAEIIGGIAGGLFGKQVGHRNGRTAATATGAITGTMVGKRMSSQPSYYAQNVQRCRAVVDQVQVPVYPEQPKSRCSSSLCTLCTENIITSNPANANTVNTGTMHGMSAVMNAKKSITGFKTIMTDRA